MPTANPEAPVAEANNKKNNRPNKKLSHKSDFYIDEKEMKKLNLVAVAYSYIEPEWFPTQEAYESEREVEYRAGHVVEELEKLGIHAKAYAGDQYFFTNLLVDKPDLVLNLVDTLRGKDSLQTSIPAALVLANIPFTGAGMQGLVIGNDRNLTKQLLVANDIPTPPFQFIRKKSEKINPDLDLPLIVKLNEGGGSVGIDNNAVKETIEEAEARVQEMIEMYKMPVVVERFINGPEITVVVFDDGKKKHVFMGEKVFGFSPDGKHNFTSWESYQSHDAYKYKKVKKELQEKIAPLALKAFTALHNRDYSKFDVRLDEETGTPYFTDANPNTAFGPDKGLPFTEVLDLHGIPFQEALASLMSKHAREIREKEVQS